MAVTEKALLVYGVWLRGKGWLKAGDQGEFGDVRIEYAQSVARVYGRGAEIRLIDDSMIALEKLFLERERQHWTSRLKRGFYGLLVRRKKSSGAAK